MRRLIHLTLSPASRFARLILGEKRLTYDPVQADDTGAHLPAFIDIDGTKCEGLWAIVDHLEGAYPDHPLVPEEPESRGECFRFLDWAMGPLHERVTRKIVFERGGQKFTGSSAQRAPDMNIVRAGREALKDALVLIGATAERQGYIAGRECSLGDLALAAHISALDYFGEVPWPEHSSAAEWYMKMKSRPSFRSVLADRVPGQPPVLHYAELDI